MKKLYIINPMVGRNIKDTLYTFRKLRKLVEVMCDEEFEIVEGNLVTELSSFDLKDLARHIEYLSKADVVVCLADWYVREHWIETGILEEIAHRYGKEVIKFNAEYVAPDCGAIYNNKVAKVCSDPCTINMTPL